MRRVTIIAAPLLLLGAFACKSTQDSAGTDTEGTRSDDVSGEAAASAGNGAPATANVPAAAPAEAQLTATDLPLPADFDPEAEREITDENVAEQLAAAEREVAADEQAPLPALKP